MHEWLFKPAIVAGWVGQCASSGRLMYMWVLSCAARLQFVALCSQATVLKFFQSLSSKVREKSCVATCNKHPSSLASCNKKCLQLWHLVLIAFFSPVADVSKCPNNLHINSAVMLALSKRQTQLLLPWLIACPFLGRCVIACDQHLDMHL